MVARSENELASHRRHLGRGFNWLGGATTVAKITDFSTIIVVLLFLTKTRLGIGSLVLSIGMVVEAFDGLGTGDALVQAPSIDTRQLRRLFWFILAAAIAVAGHCRCPPLFGWIYGMAGLPVDFLAVAAKQPLVGAAVIPLALLNRELRYERIALINVGATFGAALVRLGLALGGGGVWCCLPPFWSLFWPSCSWACSLRGVGLFGWAQAPLPRIALVLTATALAYAGLFWRARVESQPSGAAMAPVPAERTD